MATNNEVQSESPLQTSLNNLARAYSEHRAGGEVDPRQVALNLTTLHGCLKNQGNPYNDPGISKLTRPPEKKKSPLVKTLAFGTLAAIAAIGGISIGGGALAKGAIEVLAQGGTAPIRYDKGKLYLTPTAKPAAGQTPTKIVTDIKNDPTPTVDRPQPKSTATRTAVPTPTASPVPTASPEELAKKEVGSVNLAEYFLGDLIKIFKEKRLEKFQQDPGYAERVNSEFLVSDNANFLYLGIDNTRERINEFNEQGWGRSDVIMLISFNPHTFQTTAISFPRDMFAPELISFKFDGGAKINSATMAPYVKPGVDSFELMRKIIESATGIPVDTVIKTNVDFTQGHKENYVPFPGFFDELFPEGLKIHVDKKLEDPGYPTDNYGSKDLIIPEGDHIMHGRELTEYGRSRHTREVDFGRSERQRTILMAATKSLLPDLVKDFIGGNTTTIDRLMSALEKQEGYTNLSSDINLTEVLKTMEKGVKELRKDPKGLASLAPMAANSANEVGAVLSGDDAFKSLGLTRENELVQDVNPEEEYYKLFMLKVTGSPTISVQTDNGNFLQYWDPIRKFVYSFVRGQ